MLHVRLRPRVERERVGDRHRGCALRGETVGPDPLSASRLRRIGVGQIEREHPLGEVARRVFRPVLRAGGLGGAVDHRQVVPVALHRPDFVAVVVERLLGVGPHAGVHEHRDVPDIDDAAPYVVVVVALVVVAALRSEKPSRRIAHEAHFGLGIPRGRGYAAPQVAAHLRRSGFGRKAVQRIRGLADQRVEPHRFERPVGVVARDDGVSEFSARGVGQAVEREIGHLPAAHRMAVIPDQFAGVVQPGSGVGEVDDVAVADVGAGDELAHFPDAFVAEQRECAVRGVVQDLEVVVDLPGRRAPVGGAFLAGPVLLDVVEEQVHGLDRLGHGPVEPLLVLLHQQEAQDHVRIAPRGPVVEH